MKFECLGEVCEGFGLRFPLARDARFLVASDVPLALKGERNRASIVGVTGLAHTNHIVAIGDMPSGWLR